MKAKATPHNNGLIIIQKTINKLIFLFLFIALLTATFYSQVQEEWVQRYNGPGDSDDVATAIAVDASGNVYVTGESRGTGIIYDYATIKYNTNGVQQWVQRYHGPGIYNDEASSVAVDGSGNVFVTGGSYGSGTGYDYATIKYNANGIQQWVQRYNGPGDSTDNATSIYVDNSGNVYVTGISIGSGTGWGYDYATIKYNAIGVQQWVQRYNGPGNGNDQAYSIAVDGSGNVYVTGSSIGNGTIEDYTTIKYNAIGAQQWIQRYNGLGNGVDVAYSLAVDGSGNVYVTGKSDGGGLETDYATIKYNTNGVQQWVKLYNGPGNSLNQASSIAVDVSGNVYVTGGSWGNGNDDYATIKYDSNGIQQWVQRYNGPGNGSDIAYSLAVDGSGNVYVTGLSRGSGTGVDYATIKYGSNGVQQWVQRYNGPRNDWDAAYALAIDILGNVYVTGGSWGSGTYIDYATIKYSQNIGIKRISSEVPDRYALYQNYPNPFNPSTKIKFDIPDFPLMKGARGMSVRLTIFDLLGREIATLVNEQLKPGSYEVEWDGSNYPSGVYFYKLITGEFTKTMKMVLIK
ncbi:MAG: SBBP repeat-containing protein [Ignavibacteria bacterium]|jgi:hypothetical protein